MPEYLAPGVFIEEVSFRSKSIEGVPTSTTGMAGMTRYGPVCYPGGPLECEPRLITSFTEFERVYGGLELLEVGLTTPGVERLPYLAHAVRSFFENGGKRIYISRVFVPRNPNDPNPDWGLASRDVVIVGTDTATWTARWPGAAGNVYVKTEIMRSKNLAYTDDDFGRQAQRVKKGAVVEVIAGGIGDPSLVPDGNDDLVEANLRVVDVDTEGRQSFIDNTGSAITPGDNDVIQLVEMIVTVTVNNERLEQYTELAAHPDQKRYIGRIMGLSEPEDQDLQIYFDWDPENASHGTPEFLPALVMLALQGQT
ncbi:MAG: phage tail sheath family protein, partial [Gammaproteobacteria bacterium]